MSLLKAFSAFVDDETVRHKILVQNPEALFGFVPKAGA
jgi:predicted TIM-barrel fold metal-dependent hydrolase